MARRNPVTKVGGYAAPVDTQGMEKSMTDLFKNSDMPKNMSKVERDYVSSKDNSESSIEAVRRTRRANKRQK